jgi:hypothetical protein
MNNSNDAVAFAAAREALGRANTTGWRWPDKDGNQHDGPELVGEYVADDHHNQHDVDIAVIRTGVDIYRSLFFWPYKKDGQVVEPPEYHLVPRWKAANPQIGDVVAIRQNKKPSTVNPGQRYNDYTVVVHRADDAAAEDESAGREGDRDEFGF